MNRMLNSMRALAALAANSARSETRMGLVSSYDPNAYAVKVRVQPEDMETGWLPLSSPWVGNGWGLFSPPGIGDMVEVHFLEGNVEAGYASQRFYNDQDRPLACPSGEFWLVHKSGSMLKFHNDGSVQVVAPAGVSITGNVHVTSGDVVADGISLKSHVHGGVESGPSTTGGPQ